MKQREKLERLLFVSRMREVGDEPLVRKVIEEEFPKRAFERAGFVGFTAYLGGGYCVFEFGFQDRFETVFELATADPLIAEYFERIGTWVDPAPQIEPGATASQPIAADVFLWRIESGLRAREANREA